MNGHGQDPILCWPPLQQNELGQSSPSQESIQLSCWESLNSKSDDNLPRQKAIPLSWVDDETNKKEGPKGEEEGKKEGEGRQVGEVEGSSSRRNNNNIMGQLKGEKPDRPAAEKRRKVSIPNSSSRKEATTTSKGVGCENVIPFEFNKVAPAPRQKEGDEEASLLIRDIIDFPGIPMAHSTPMMSAAGGSSSSHSAFAVLQPPAAPVFPAHQQQNHFMIPMTSSTTNGYFFSSPMDHPPPLNVFPPTSYNPWMRWPPVAAAMNFPQPGFIGGMKMEMMMDAGGSTPSRLTGRETKTPKMVAGNKRTSRKTEMVKKDGKREGQQQMDGEEDSGFQEVQEEVIFLSNTDNGAVGGIDAAVPLLIPPAMTQQLHPINSYETYCTVPGRLTLLSNLKKYRVSVAEIQRRLAPPECLNASILGGILRKAKNKHGGKLLREQLLTYGVELTTGRRKQGPLTSFTSLVEEEAGQLARDFRLVTRDNYPVKSASAFTLNGINNTHDATACRLELYYASKFVSRLLDFHKADRTPHADHFKQEPAEEQPVELDPALQAGLANFSLSFKLTHGFGGHTFQTVLESMICVLNESNDSLNRKYQPTPGQMATNQANF